MNLFRRIFSDTGLRRPPLACGISPAGVVAARGNQTPGELVSAFAPLSPGALSQGGKAPNLHNRAAVIAALRQALDAVNARDRRTTVVIPDAAVRVLLLDFDSLPAKNSEALPIVRFRLRKLVPFDMEDAALSYQTITVPGAKENVVRVIAAVCPSAIRDEYESAVREAGYEPGAVFPSTLAALAAVSTDDAALIVNRWPHSVTTAIVRKNELLLHRTLEVAFEPDNDRLSEEMAHRAVDELQRSVSVAAAYFEDTLASPPRELLASGPGGADELARLLADPAIAIRDLVPGGGGRNTVPRGMLAGVVGALAA